MQGLAARLLVGVVVCHWCVCAAAAGADLKAEIMSANAEFSAAFKKGDAKALSEMYTEKGRLLPPNSEMVEGRPAIEKFWQVVLAQGPTGIELETLEVESFGETAVESGRATVYGNDGEVADEAKYLVVWKKSGGKWKLHRDCWNSNGPVKK